MDLKIKGISIIVSKAAIETFSLYVIYWFVGFSADCEATAQQAASSSSCDIGVTTAISGCDTSAPIAAPSQQDTCLSFNHKKCHTPFVTEVSPNTGTSQQEITIKGRGFSATQCQNVVMFGSHACNITSHSETSIKCKIDLTSKPKPGESYEISVVVKNRGNALIQPAPNSKTNFVLLPRVNNVTPSSGSEGGGTTLTLTGDGFSETLAGNTVIIGTSVSCKVKTAAYKTLTCVTEASSSSEAKDVITETGGVKSSCSQASCKFTFSSSVTPLVSEAQSTNVTGVDHILTLLGSGYGTTQADVSVTVGEVTCVITELLDGSIKCRIPGASAGQHAIKVHHNNNGLAVFKENVTTSITVFESISSLSPSEGSTEGGLSVDINGFGFNTAEGKTTVKVNNKDAKVVSVSISKVVITTPANAAGNVPVLLTSGGVTFPTKQFTYSAAATPEITSISPSSAAAGQELTLSGTFPSATTSSAKVKIGNWSCTLTAATTSEIKCTVPGKPAGKYPVSLVVDGKGNAKSSAEFSIDLSLTSINPTESGHGGGRVIVVKGSGFSDSTIVKVCSNVCVHVKSTPVTDTQISCEVPQSDPASHSSDSTCAVTATMDTFEKTLNSAFTYRLSMTSRVESVSPSRGGTGGGVVVTIKGSGFSTTQSDNKVTIDGTACAVTSASETEIQCKTGAHNRTIKTNVRVEVGNDGKAVGVSDSFYYVDVWSSIYSWGGQQPPEKGTVLISNVF